MGICVSIEEAIYPVKTAELVPVRLQPDEYDPYYERYISLVPGADVMGALQTQIDQTSALLSAVGEDQAAYRYAPGSGA